MNEYSKQFQCKDGRTVLIELSESGDAIEIRTPSGEKIGGVELSYKDDDRGDYYRLTWMYMDELASSYKRQGIGRAALLFHKEIFGCPIEVAVDDGSQKADGSHLTQDAPAFADRMVREGVLFRESIDVSDED